MEDNITEKFALLNLIKALQGISAPEESRDTPPEEQTPPPAPAVPEVKTAEFNAMASILARHEAISNRIKNKK